ncbi:MAG TPA: TIGR03067 domain-containing protein [Gemmataceae bacterium]|jgi:uncharacterized protein (TIGR03067 family)|nr:TIGR03067 domain-containing protein [Gemmataceae bacterium]
MNTSQALAAVAVILLLCAAAPADNDITRGARQLQGEWRVVSTGDENRTDAGSEDLKMTIRADGHVLFQVADLTTNDGRLKLGRSDKTAAIDLKLADGQTLLGVYELRGNDLIICFDEGGKRRPAGIAPRGTQWVEKWTRAKRGGDRGKAAPRSRDANTPTVRKLWERP